MIIIVERFWANTRAIAPSGWRLLSTKTSPPRLYWLYWILVIFKASKPIQIKPIKLDKPDLVWILVYPHQTKVYPIQLHHWFEFRHHLNGFRICILAVVREACKPVFFAYIMPLIYALVDFNKPGDILSIEL